ncbi:MAG: hypothetical protein KIT27_08520 [Legionellales bacterium]|nr:hypothetical protein [Legionellales bacterium]
MINFNEEENTVDQYTLDSLISSLHHNLMIITYEIKKILDSNNIDFDKELTVKITDSLSKLNWAKQHLDILKNQPEGSPPRK